MKTSEVFLLWANVRQKVGRGLKDDAIESLGFEERTTASLFESEVIDEDDRGKEETRKSQIIFSRGPKKKWQIPSDA
jgi:hypothetical protein